MEDTDAVIAMAALAQPTRLKTFRLLVRSEPGGLPAGEIARVIGVPQNTMSAHLNSLARAGLVAGQRRSRKVIYRANVAQLGNLTGFLVNDCCGGNPEACAALAIAAPSCRP